MVAVTTHHETHQTPATCHSPTLNCLKFAKSTRWSPHQVLLSQLQAVALGGNQQMPILFGRQKETMAVTISWCSVDFETKSGRITHNVAAPAGPGPRCHHLPRVAMHTFCKTWSQTYPIIAKIKSTLTCFKSPQITVIS